MQPYSSLLLEDGTGKPGFLLIYKKQQQKTNQQKRLYVSHQIIVLHCVKSHWAAVDIPFPPFYFLFLALEKYRCDTESSFILPFVYELHLQPFIVLPTAGHKRGHCF